MPRDPWARLASPFSHAALAWRVAELDEGGALARLAPLVRASAVSARLDEVVGIAGWSFQLVPAGPDTLVGNLTVQGVTRAAVVRAGRGPSKDPDRAADEALSLAALRFGMRPPVDVGAAYWVDYDPEADEPLHLPDVETIHPSAPERVASEPSGASDVGSDVGSDAGAGAGVAVEPVGAAVVDEEGPSAMTAKGGADARPDTRAPGAHEVIERLIERLREEGLGKEAALLVVRYQGYGRTPEESRELYGRLRALLLEKGATVS